MKKILFISVLWVLIAHLFSCKGEGRQEVKAENSSMLFADSIHRGVPFTKDPHVIAWKGKYLMYYSIGGNPAMKWGIGIAESRDLNQWTPIAEITPETDYEQKGFCAPGAIVRNDTIHLFYQTYGNGRKDAICHAWSVDGVHFTRNSTNPIFSPDPKDWNCGRAIDAEVALINNTYFLYYATRTLDFKIQLVGVASTSKKSDFMRESWTERSDKAILAPEYPWEGACIEAPSIVVRNGVAYMFYAGAYNNQPQQVGVAKSIDGIHWEKMSNKPFFTNGDPGSWNSCESGHPHLFQDTDGSTSLFFQGNKDFGKSWYISRIGVEWSSEGPVKE